MQVIYGIHDVKLSVFSNIVRAGVWRGAIHRPWEKTAESPSRPARGVCAPRTRTHGETPHITFPAKGLEKLCSPRRKQFLWGTTWYLLLLLCLNSCAMLCTPCLPAHTLFPPPQLLHSAYISPNVGRGKCSLLFILSLILKYFPLRKIGLLIFFSEREKH